MSEIILQPVAIFKDPFRRGKNLLVLCETMRWTDKTFSELVPANTNFRAHAKKIFDNKKDEKYWFGIEQEYSLLVEQNNFTTHPLGFPSSGFPGPQGPYYCSVGANNCYGREVMDAHYRCCLYAGIKVSGTNAEVMPGQWEFQIGPCEGIQIGDHLWMARYILGRISEDYGVIHSFEPKLFADWNGAGCHTNFSNELMRSGNGGMEYIEEVCAKLKGGEKDLKHKLHISLYGNNKDRLTGIHETSRLDQFSHGVGNRAASVRIPTQVKADNGKGYIEDRRPASDIDPYVIGAIIIDTCSNSESLAEPMIAHYRAW
jgi:glutamine synthetase